MSFAAKVLSHRTLRRRHVFGLVLLALLVVWSALWIVAAIRANDELDAWIEAAKGKNIAIDYGRRHTNGTPFSIHVHFHDMALAAKDGVTLQAGEAVFYIGLWSKDDVSAKLRDGVSGKIAGTPFSAASLKFGVTCPEHAPASHEETGLTLWVHPYVMTFKPDVSIPLGNTLDEGVAEVRLMGDVPDFLNQESIKAWNEAGGVIEVDRLFLKWGPMTLTASGTLGLDPRLQPEGAFSSRIEGLDATLDALTEQGAIDARQESLLRSSLNVLARPSGLTGATAPVVPITAQNSALYLGPVKLMALPKIEW